MFLRNSSCTFLSTAKKVNWNFYQEKGAERGFRKIIIMVPRPPKQTTLLCRHKVWQRMFPLELGGVSRVLHYSTEFLCKDSSVECIYQIYSNFGQ